ncbi:cytochrome c oxidase subunit I [Sinorhizobium meliloti]|uniref:cytochrome c oxidase subunit I n=1 Tax=Rhizobium meliloti TaxID=382 RepID=UPI000FDA7D86|nr:cytochrome c oxidase subunit I [Sinorhizobium meliloti]MDX0026512.1 cytochrome c oxidase subunit I [Sinorhizobium meliloti]MDX0070209.1 cytochrome c oxidase subunit I [Sinorhizobium meliloti]RVH68244.1 cytochrome c oxidase subunit I [Sinorhizobium meliloti]RVK69343.1 cytochrome c oxidase subunit I [Sinorhizobium meliloti]
MMVDVRSGIGEALPPPEVEDVELYHPHSWWTRYVFSQDAKIIAIQYSMTAIAIGMVALVLSWLIRLQLGFPGTFELIDAERYYQFITMHGMIMVIYLLTALFLGGFGNYLIPLMVGARDMVFPYANMLSYWIYLLAVIVLAASFFTPGGPTGAGWTLYPPQAVLSGTPGGRDWGIIMMLSSLIIFVIGFTMGGLNYVVTVLQGRARGMTLMRLPLTVWGIFTATVMALLAFPALFVACVMMLFDRLLGTSFFMPAIVEMGEQLQYGGGSPILFQHLFWFFGHPEVYIVALPAFGIVSDLISTHARKNIFGYRMMVWAIVIIGGLSFIVWAHHMYVSGMNPYFGFFFATTTLIIAVPTAIKVYNWVLTLWRGNIHLTPPMLFALAFIVTFVNGGLTGLFLGNVVVDVPLSDTMFVVAHFHMVMGVAPIMVIFGAIYHWYPKITGRMLNEAMGQIHFWVTFIGAYAIFFPMHYLGLIGVPRRYHELGEASFVTTSIAELNAFISVMALLVGAAQIVFLFNLAWSLRHGREAGGNPWRATTLEWQTPETPPPHGNWGNELPVVYRWAYDYSVPGAPEDFIPQNQPTPGRLSHETVS